MILVDTSVWAVFFNAGSDPHADRLVRALSDGEELATSPIIVTETLQGFRSERGFAQARDLLTQLPLLVLELDGHVEAAGLFRALRKKGVTVRGAVDCIIAQTAIHYGAELLTRDRDFKHVAEHLPLHLTVVETEE